MVRFLERCRAFYAGWYYPAIVWLLVLVGHTTEMDLLFGGIMLMSVEFGLWICHDVRFTMMPLMSTFFIIPIGDYTPSDPGYDRYFEPASFIPLVSLALIVAGSIVFFVIRNRRIANPIPKNGIFTSILILCGALAINGIFSPNYTPRNFLFIIFLILAMPIVYLLFAGFLRFEKSVTDYFMTCLVGIGMLIAIELIIAYFTTVEFVDGNIVKESVVLGWGVWTNIGCMLVFFMPASFYFAASHRRGWIGYLLGLFQYFCIVLSQSRAALLVGSFSLLLCLLYLFIKGDYRKRNRIITLSLVAVGLLGGILIYDKLIALVNNFLQYGFGDNGRFALWQSAWKSFLRAPIFGAGFYDTCSYEGWATFGMPQMCHNTILQFFGSAGIVGVLAYAYHRFETVRLAIRKPNPVKIFLSICIIGFLLFGMLDVVFFIGYPNIFYAMMLLFMQYSERAEESFS